MLRADTLCFKRNDAVVLDNVSFTVMPAQLVKITGGNGGGKTTLLKMLCHLHPPDSGCLYWNGAPVADDVDSYREQVIYIGHGNALADELTALENLRASAGLRQLAPAQPLAQALAAAGMAADDRLCRYLSAGQRRRAALARLQAFAAKLWLLDEPLAALDVAGRAMLTGWLAAHLAGGGMAVCTMHTADDWQVPAAAVLECSGASCRHESAGSAVATNTPA